MSARRVAVLTLGLPHQSRTMRAAEPDAWPTDETLLGLIVERLDMLSAITVKANGGKRVKEPPPIVPRPKRPRRMKPAVAATDLLADLDRAMGVG